MPTWTYAVVPPPTVVPVPTVPMIVIVVALIIVIVSLTVIVMFTLIVVLILSEGRYWKQQSRRYGANERKISAPFGSPFCFRLIKPPCGKAGSGAG